MDALLTSLLTALVSLGPIGAVIAAVIVGLGLALILFASSKDLWSSTRGRSQGVEFQDRMLALIDKLTASEEALRKRIDELSRENGLMRDEVDELRASLALLRNQRRKLIELMRAVKEGRTLPPRRTDLEAAT